MSRNKAFYQSLPPVDYSLASAIETDVVYKLFLHPNDDNGKILVSTNVSEHVAKEHLIKTAPTVLLIHGWTTDDTSPWYKPLKDGYLQLGVHNIIYINWWKAGSKSYDVSCANTESVGRFIAQFLLDTGIPLENVHVIGHSLGSHVASSIGKSIFKRTSRKLGRITALDPAGPKFDKFDINTKIFINDADFVDVVHTDIQYYGYTRPAGHVDFYPNSGKHQNGCPQETTTEEEANCSHARSTLYFIESLTRKAKAQEADYVEEVDEVFINVKENAKVIVFGQHVDRDARGVFSSKPILNHHF